VFGGFGGFVLLCGGCCGVGIYFSFGEITRQSRADLVDNSVIQEHIGDIQSFEMDWMATLQASSDGQENTFVFDIKGDKASGTVVVELPSDDSGQFHVASGELTLESGDVHQLIEGADLSSGIDIDGTMSSELLDAGGKEFAGQVQTALAGNAVLAEHIGDITSITYDLEMSTAEPGEDVYVFHLEGAKANGRLRAECITVDASTESVTSAQVLLDNGEAVQLFPDKPLE
jgi:hypothetical protein